MNADAIDDDFDALTGSCSVVVWALYHPIPIVSNDDTSITISGIWDMYKCTSSF